eukprot:CAMPEP_0173222014 /NCGR_PEP_ID=MMETSP1142-20121109/3029_1 /TAXON_ID=483371 /ORGANISM="non described non described, Strain CCMP2298" /LENGTH=31 /DNA_ID= /DNA_START= /DNA_END= /DNA_ORIENTATION=
MTEALQKVREVVLPVLHAHHWARPAHSSLGG